MPIYEYRCASCGHEFETLQKFSDAPLVRCPACSAEALVKRVSAGGFHLKGSGWYATDFKGSGSKPAEKKDGAETKGDAKNASPADAAATGGGEAKSESKGESKGESKSDAKAETKSAATSTPSSGGGTPAAT